MKKAGFILLLAGLTYGVASLGYFRSWPNAAVALLLMASGAALLIAGMRRSGPRDEELPTAEARRPGR